MRHAWLFSVALVCGGCTAPTLDEEPSADPHEDSGLSDTGNTDTGAPFNDTGYDTPTADAFADEAIRFEPGVGAGYGQDLFPDVVLGPPNGHEAGTPSLDVLTLGKGGIIELAFTDVCAIDGQGPDILVFENPFSGWQETGIVSASDDGKTWHAWPCSATNIDQGYPGCAGVSPVFANAENELDPTDPDEAGGDAFDLADLGLERACFVRIEDSGENVYYGDHSTTDGFDLDAVAVVNGETVTPE